MNIIDPLGGFVYAENAKSEKKKTAGKKTGRVSFASSVDRAIREEAAAAAAPPDVMGGEGLEALLDEIHTLGERLAESPTFERVAAYKQAVKGFLSFVVRNSFSVEEHESRANILNRKRYTLITVIDTKLDQLAAGVLLNQRNQLELLGRVNEIQGLLVDLSR